MQIFLFGVQQPTATVLNVKGAPYGTVVTETEIAVGVAITPITGVIVPNSSYLVVFMNTSPAAQTIRVGNAPAYAPPAPANVGILLAVNAVLILENIAVAQSAIASAAGATLSVIVYRT